MYKYYENTLKYQKTPKGVLNTIYRNQLTKQKRKGIEVKYSYDEFKDKYLNDKTFIRLFNRWLKNNCQSNLKPSFDRIDSNKSYSFDNLQIITWEENNKKGRVERSKKVDKYDLSDKFIKSYDSVRSASEDNNIFYQGIVACCNGRIKTSGGYIWKYGGD